MASDVREPGNVLADTQLFAREPWRIDRQRRTYQCRSIRPIDEATKNNVADLAKNTLLAPLEVLSLPYLGFSVEKGPETLVSLLTEADHKAARKDVFGGVPQWREHASFLWNDEPEIFTFSRT